MIYERLADGHNDLKRITREHLEQFGATGLRTLCLAYKHLSSDVYESWNEKFIQAKSALRDREKKLDEVCNIFLVYVFGFLQFSCLLPNVFCLRDFLYYSNIVSKLVWTFYSLGFLTSLWSAGHHNSQGTYNFFSGFRTYRKRTYFDWMHCY